MLKLTSRFILEVLPYLIFALVAAVVVPGFVNSLITVTLPGFFYSDARGMEAMVIPNGPRRDQNALELIRQDYEALAAKDDLLNR